MRNKNAEKTVENRMPEAPADTIFALDIGTRSVIGIVGVPENGKLRIEAVESEEHKKRAMIDGQIEDIEQVSVVSRHVKEKLEKRLGYRLKRVCVAAAGRALKTQRATFEMELDQSKPIRQDLVCRLEAGAIEAAEKQFEPDGGADGTHVFYLVGYSVTEYRLDDYPISNLLEHHGKSLAVDVIATFLPREVVDSLYTTMNKTDLEVSSLTLEPIAAMNAAIPEKLRLLNLALVDIGAGTSDIAVSKDGSVVAYTMATVAGDEITEAIMKKYLVEFGVAETIKHQMDGDSEIPFQDVLGFDQTIHPDQLRQDLEPDIRALCGQIAHDIVKVNNGAPSAVFLVGGGSKLPGMCGFVAQALNLPENRVAIGGNNFMHHISEKNDQITGPEFATPLGIAVSAALNLISDSFSITLNGGRAKLFRSKKLTILDVLMMNGYSYNQLISRSGRSAVIEINGENRIFYGEHPQVAKIKVNGVETTVSTLVNAGDEITFEPSVPGSDAQPFLYDAVPFHDPGTVTLNGEPYDIGTQAAVNGLPASPDQILHHHDRVEYSQITTLGDLLRSCGESTEDTYQINGTPAWLDTVLADGDEITVVSEQQDDGAVWDVPEQNHSAPEDEPVPVQAVLPQELPDSPPEPEPPVQAAEEEAEPKSPVLVLTLNHETLTLPQKADGSPYFLMDMLNLVDMDLSKPEGRMIVLRVNGKDAAYLQKLQDGDEIEIYWQNP